MLAFRRFFQTACDVPELQDKFNVDEYSDLVTLTKPVIYISIGEIINTHTVSVLLSVASSPCSVLNYQLPRPVASVCPSTTPRGLSSFARYTQHIHCRVSPEVSLATRST